MSNFLKFGDLVLLYQGPASQPKPQEPQSIEADADSAGGGVLTSLGYIDQGIYMQQLPKLPAGEQFKLNSDVNMFGLRTCVFTLTPKLNFDFHKDFKKTMEYYKRLELSLRTCKPEEKQELVALRDDLKAKLIKLEERTKKEEQLNFSIVREHIGKVIQYGSEVQIMHYDSNSFVRATNDCSQTETIGYMCELSNFYSGGMVFRVSPRYRSRQDGDAIQLRDNVIFQNVRHKGYLSVSRELPIHADLRNEANRNPFLVHTATFEPRLNRHRIYISQDEESSYQVVLFRNHMPDSHHYLLGGDIVKISHTEIQADLSASICHDHLQHSEPEVYFRAYEGEFKEEATSLSSYWTVESMKFEEAGEKLKVQSKVVFTNSKHSSTIRLRHFLTGTVITTQKSSSNPADTELFITDSSSKPFAAFDIEPVIKNCGYLLNNQIYFITDSASGGYLKEDKAKKYERDCDQLMRVFESHQPPTSPHDFFYPLENSDLAERKTCAILSGEFSSEDAFIIQKISEAEKKNILIVRSSIPLLKYVRKMFYEKQKEERMPEVYNLTISLLQKLIAFLFDLDLSNQIDWFEIEEMPSVKKQKLLKDVGFIDVIIEIIYLPFALQLHSIKSINMNTPFARMLEMAYTTLRYGIKEYRPNELYASQWLPLLIQQSLETTVDRDIRAGQTLTELIDNNEKILESRIELSTINKFISILRDSDKDSKYVEILRAICISDGKPMIKNQKDITKRLLENEEDRQKLIFGVLKDPVQGVMLTINSEGYRSIQLSQLQTASKNIDESKTYDFVISMLRLLSDLCKQRNYLAIDKLQRDFSFDLCFEVVSNNEYGFRERQAFTVLLTNLWIDVTPLQRIILPNLVKSWDDPSKLDMSKSKNQTQSEYSERLVNFIFKNLEQMSSYPQLEVDDDIEDQLHFDISILDLVQNMMSLGLLCENSHLNSIIGHLLTYLRKTSGSQAKKKLRSEGFTKSATMMQTNHMIDNFELPKAAENISESEEIEAHPRIIEIKKKICEILQFCLMIKIEHRVQDFLVELKQAGQSLQSKLTPELLQRLEQTDDFSNILEVPNGMSGQLNEQHKALEKSEIDLFDQLNEVVSKVDQKKSRLHLERSGQFLDILLDLIRFERHDIKSAALKLLHILYHQSSMMSNIMTKLQIIDNSKGESSFLDCQRISLQLDKLADSIEKWYPLTKSSERDELFKIVNNLHLKLLKKTDSDGLPGLTDNELEKNHSFERNRGAALSGFTSSNQEKISALRKDPIPSISASADIHDYIISSHDEVIHPFEQNILRNSGIIRGLIVLLEFDAETQEETERDQSNTDLLKVVYRVLAKCSKGNDQNKEVLSQYLDSIFIKHFQKNEADENSIFLIRELIFENKQILLNEQLVRKTATSLCSVAAGFRPDDICKGFILNSLSYFLKYKSFVLAKNQNSVLSLIISKEYRSLQIHLEAAEVESELLKEARNKPLNRHFKMIEGRKVLVFPAELSNLIAYLDLLSGCAESRNPFSENICQNILSLEVLSRYLHVSDFVLVLKHSLVTYFYNAYLDTEREIPFHLLEVFLTLVKNLLDQFEFYCKKKFTDSEELAESAEDLRILTSNSFKSFGQWVRDHIFLLIKCFTNVIRRNLNLISDSEPARDFEKCMLSLLDYIQIGLEKYKEEELCSKFKQLIREIYLKHSSGTIADKIKEKYRDLISPKLDSKESRKGNVIDNTYLSRHMPAASVEKSPVAFKKFQIILAKYFKSSQFNLKCEEEFNLLVKEIKSLNGQHEETDSSRQPIALFFKSLVAFLDPIHEHEEDNTTYITAIKLFRRYIEYSKEFERRTTILELDIEEWKDFSPNLKPRQDLLVKIGLIDLVTKIISTKRSPEIVRENMLAGIAILFGGNLMAQQGFLQAILADKDSAILEKLQQTLTECFESIRKNMREQNNLTLKLFYIKFDTNQSFKGSHEEEIERQKSLLAIRREIESLDENYKICQYIFKFLQLLCEGHNQSIQNLLRQQNFESSVSEHKSINFIALTSGLWGSYIKFVNPSCIDLGISILDFVIESSQGPCELNQKEFYHNKIVDFSKDFMNDFHIDRDFASRGFRGEEKARLDQLITQTIRMTNALLEANQDRHMYEYIGTNIDFQYLINKLQQCFTAAFKEVDLSSDGKSFTLETIEPFINPQKFEVELAEAFDIFFFIQNIEDNTGMYKQRIKELKGQQKIIYDFFSKNSGHIEIVFQNTIQKVYFMIHPICKCFDDNQKKQFLDNAKRETPNEKITDLMTQAPAMFDKMDHISNLRSRIKLISENTLNLIRDCCLVNILVINLYIFFTFRKSIDRMEFKTVSNSFTDIFFWIFGLLHIVLSISMIIIWLLLNSKLVLMDGWRERFTRYKKLASSSGLTAVKTVKEHKKVQEILQRNQINNSKADIIEVIRFYSFLNLQMNPLPGLEYGVQNLLFILQNGTFKFFFFYLSLTALAFSGKFYFLYSIHLLDIINRFDTLQNVIKAITYNKSQLLLTAFLTIILLYFYALFGFTYMDDTFFMGAVEPAGENMCNTLLQCFTVVLSLGPRSSGSVGDVLLRPTYSEELRVRYYIRWIYDVSIFFIINIICMKLIFGIIIDTFAQLRDKKYQIDYDKNNVCFICGLDRYVFDKNADGFENHIRRDHNIWNYLYFMYVLKRKDPTEFNGIDSYVHRKLLLEDVSWIPLKLALCLKKVEQEKDNLEAKFLLIQEEIDKIEQKYTSLSKLKA